MSNTPKQPVNPTEIFMLPEYGVSVEAKDPEHAASLAKSQQKGSAKDAD